MLRVYDTARVGHAPTYIMYNLSSYINLLLQLLTVGSLFIHSVLPYRYLNQIFLIKLGESISMQTEVTNVKYLYIYVGRYFDKIVFTTYFR